MNCDLNPVGSDELQRLRDHLKSVKGVVQEEIIIPKVAPEQVSVLFDLEQDLSNDSLVLDGVSLTHNYVILVNIPVDFDPEVIGVNLNLFLHLYSKVGID